MNSHLYGISLKITSVAVITVMFSLIKATSGAVPLGEQVFFRAFVPLLILALWFSMRGQFWVSVRTKRLKEHFFRSAFGGVAMVLKFLALGLLALPDVTALSFAMPLILTILAALLLGETVRAFRITTVILGFVGVGIVLWPKLNFGTTQSEVIGITAILTSAFFVAMAMVYVRRLMGTEANYTVVFYQSLFISGASILTLPFGWSWPPMDVALMMIGSGVCGLVGQLLLTASLRHAPASVIAPFEYVAMLFAIGIGIFWFDEFPTVWTIIGATVIILSGLAIVWRERQLKAQT